MRRSRLYWFIKALRLAGWCLLAVMIGFLFSGYAMTGRWHLGRFVSAQEGKDWHLLLHIPLVVLLVAHAAPAAFFAWLRWFKKRYRH
jgi:cytochrome b561